MTKPAFLVEGDLEQKFIQNTCPGAPVQKIGCNGDAVAIASIAKRVGTLGRLLHKRASVIVVVFDREQRAESSEQIEAQFRDALIDEGIEVPVIVGVPDRDIENWILADFESFIGCARITTENLEEVYEGLKGKTQIKKLLGPGRSYVETIDGVSWLKSCRPSVMKEHSDSFRRFANALASLPCWWLSQPHLT